MKVQEFMIEINNTYPDIDKNRLTPDELVSVFHSMYPE